MDKSAVLLSEKEKRQDDYLKCEIDSSISSCLSTDKDELIEAYNLRNGVRDVNDFRYLWEAYGIEFPAQMRHVPVLRAIFDSLVGQAIARPFKYQVSCVDSESVNYIFNEYRDAILNDLDQFWKNKIAAARYMVETGDYTERLRAQEYLDKIKKKYEQGSFKADIEIYAKDMLDWAIQRFKLKSRSHTFMDDLVTAGQTYYQVKVVQKGKKPIIRILNPLNVFYTKGTDTKFIKDCDRVVLKERVPVTEVWTLYGHKMTAEFREKFLYNWGKYIVGSDIEIIDYAFGTLRGSHDFTIQKGLQIPLVDLAYVEWKANTKVEMDEPEVAMTEGDTENKIVESNKRIKYRLDRFEGVRIGEDGYVNMGPSKYVVRDPDDPSYCQLTINGICYNDRNGKPYSHVMKTKDIADKIDILHYHAENLLAISGTKAIMINFPDIPAWLGANPIARIMKWLGMVKQGVAILDTSQPGNGAGKFQNSSDVDLSMSNAILSIYEMTEKLEATAYKVTGVARQTVGNITQSDGKGTSELAIQGSTVVTAPLFACYDEIVEEFLTDVVNACRISYSQGLQGAIILGEGQRIFSIQAGKLNLVHMNVHINGDGTEERDLDQIKAVAQSLIESQLLDVELAVDMVTVKSLSALKQKIKTSIEEKKKDTTDNLSKQLEEYAQKLKEAQKQIEQYQTQDLQSKQQELAIKQQEVSGKQDLGDKTLNQKTINDAEKLRLESKRIDLEALQLSYGNERDTEIKNN